MFNFFKKNLSKIFQTISSPFQSLFAKETINEQTIQEIKEILLKADTGIQTTQTIITNLKNTVALKNNATGLDLQQLFAAQLITALEKPKQLSIDGINIFLLVGINGSGKTTFVAKLAHFLKQNHKDPLVIAGDTFRAAASQQLKEWTDKLEIPIMIGKENQDPSSIVFDACKAFNNKKCQTLVIDTAGRLQNKEYLMAELIKIKKTIQKNCPQAQISTLLTIDAMLGQNSLEQAQLFNQHIHIDGIVLTKMDGSSKGGIVFSITDTLNIPISFISWGEKVTDMAPFNAQQYVDNLLGIKAIDDHV